MVPTSIILSNKGVKVVLSCFLLKVSKLVLKVLKLLKVKLKKPSQLFGAILANSLTCGIVFLKILMSFFEESAALVIPLKRNQKVGVMVLFLGF